MQDPPVLPLHHTPLPPLHIGAIPAPSTRPRPPCTEGALGASAWKAGLEPEYGPRSQSPACGLSSGASGWSLKRHTWEAGQLVRNHGTRRP